MRFVALAMIAGIAGFILWTAFGPDCRGTVVASEAQCVNVSGFDRAFCNAAFSKSEDAIRRAGNVFRTQQDCQVKFLTCIEFPGVHGWTPRPQGYCLDRNSEGGVERMTPVYDRTRS